jgi:hypothetical protein
MIPEPLSSLKVGDHQNGSVLFRKRAPITFNQLENRSPSKISIYQICINQVYSVYPIDTAGICGQAWEIGPSRSMTNEVPDEKICRPASCVLAYGRLSGLQRPISGL